MTVEIHDKLIALLAEVDELKSKEAQLKSEKQSIHCYKSSLINLHSTEF
jgi:hypothetical protein